MFFRLDTYSTQEQVSETAQSDLQEKRQSDKQFVKNAQAPNEWTAGRKDSCSDLCQTDSWL